MIYRPGLPSFQCCYLNLDRAESAQREAYLLHDNYTFCLNIMQLANKLGSCLSPVQLHYSLDFQVSKYRDQKVYGRMSFAKANPSYVNKRDLRNFLAPNSLPNTALKQGRIKYNNEA